MRTFKWCIKEKGEFKINGPMNTMAEGSALPQGQLGLDQIMNLISK